MRHRRRARRENLIRAAKDSGARNLPDKSFDANAIWLQIVMLAQLLAALLQRLALDGDLAVAEPIRLRPRVSATPAGSSAPAEDASSTSTRAVRGRTRSSPPPGRAATPTARTGRRKDQLIGSRSHMNRRGWARPLTAEASAVSPSAALPMGCATVQA